MNHQVHNQGKYTLRQYQKGIYQLQDSDRQNIYFIKEKEYGCDIETASKQLLYQVQVNQDKKDLRDAANKLVFSTQSPLSVVAFACFGFDVLTRKQQAALAYAVNLAA